MKATSKRLFLLVEPSDHESGHESGRDLAAADAPIAWLDPDNGARGAGPLATLPAARELWLALPSARVLLTEVALSRRALRRLGGALANALEDQLMADPAQVHAVIADGTGASDGHTPVAAVDRAWLRALLERYAGLGLHPAGALPACLLTRRPDDAWAVTWTTAGGDARTGANAGFGLDADGDATTPPAALRLALADARRRGNPPARVVVDAGAEAFDAEAWTAALDLPVTAETLAIDPAVPTLNLLRGDFAPRGAGATRLRGLAHYRLAAGLAAVALAAHVGASVLDWARLSAERKQLRADMTQTFRQVFPQAAVVDPVLQMRRQLADLRRTRGLPDAGDFLPMLAAAGLVDGIASQLDYENGRLSWRLGAAGAELGDTLERTRLTLAEQGYRLRVESDPQAGVTLILERATP